MKTSLLHELTEEERQVLDSWRAFKKVCSDYVQPPVSPFHPEAERMPRMILYEDVSGCIETCWVEHSAREQHQRVSLTLGTLFEGGYLPEPERTPVAYRRIH